MNALAAPVAVVALALAVAALSKLVDPTTTTGALRAAGVPARDAVVRVGAVVELAIAITALASGARVALAALAVSYAGFTAFVAVALRSHRPLATCGCVGRADSPPSPVHVALDGSAAIVAAVAAVTAGTAPLHVVTSESLPAALTYALLVVAGAALFLVSITLLPALLALRAPTRA